MKNRSIDVYMEQYLLGYTQRYQKCPELLKNLMLSILHAAFRLRIWEKIKIKFA